MAMATIAKKNLSLSLVRRARIRESFTRTTWPPPRNIEMLYFFELAPDFFRLSWWFFFRDTYLLFQPAVLLFASAKLDFSRHAVYIRARCCALSCVKLLPYDVEVSTVFSTV